MKRTHYNQDFKLKIVRNYLKGISTRHLCSEYKIPKSTALYWISKYRNICNTKGKIVTIADYNELNRQNERNELRLKIYKSTGLSPQSPENDRLEAINHLSKDYPVKYLCEVLAVNRTKYYRYIKKSETKTSLRRKELSAQIIEIFNENNARYGAKRIYATLKRMGINTSRRLVTDLMKANGLSVDIGQKPARPPQNYDSRRPNHLSWQKRYALSCPDVAWLSDVTEFKICGVKFYICAIQDIASRYILSYKISTHSNAKLAALTFQDANKFRSAPLSLLFHSDQGAIYTSMSFGSYLRAHGVTQSFSRKGCPHDNGHMESFFATLKKEEIYRRKYTSPEDFFKSIENYVEYYNNKRLHSCLGYQTPKEVLDYYDNALRV